MGQRAFVKIKLQRGRSDNVHRWGLLLTEPPLCNNSPLTAHAVNILLFFFFFLTCCTPSAGSLVEDIGEMILQLRRQVESLFSIKYGKLPVAVPPQAGS